MKSVITAPSRKSPTALKPMLMNTAVMPLAKMKGATGRMAPAANKKNDVMAASHAEPPSSLGSMPSSSRASVSSAVSLLASI